MKHAASHQQLRQTRPTYYLLLATCYSFLREQAPIGLLALATFLIIAMLAVILGNVFINGAGWISWEFLTSAPRQGMMAGGIYPAIFGTVFLVLLMTIAAVPVGVATAVYLNEYAPKVTLAQARRKLATAKGGARLRSFGQLVQVGLTEMTRAAVTTLAGVPSIVFGLFGLGFFIQFIGASIDQALYGGELVFGQPAVIWAALTLAILTLPVVIVATEESLRAVPQDLRDASLALGATKWQTISQVVLPQALPGILTGTILAISRGAGEVAPILFTGAAYFLPHLPTRLNDQFMHLGYHVFILSTQSPDVEKTRPILYATVLVLLVLTFSLNFVGVLIRMRVRQRLRVGR
ncbi:MAG: phosphate ABC transporter permease PstA [Acidobacteria bacterium]|nr:phosphate ABC transporter permease PstA [Acidobacteriota bacterium]